MIGRAEGMSYLLLLFIAMPLKYLADMPLAVKYVGWVHGMLFLFYLAAILMAGLERKWGIVKMFLFFLAGLLPFGPFIAEKRLLKNETH